MDRLDREDWRSPRQTWTLRPSKKSQLVSRTNNDRDRLLACAELARADTLDLLAQDYYLRVPLPA
jgi:hypothetical protein